MAKLITKIKQYDAFEDKDEWVKTDPSYAIKRSLEPDPYTYTGRSERLETQIEKLAEFSANLFAVLIESGIVEPIVAQGLLGPNVTIEWDE